MEGLLKHRWLGSISRVSKGVNAAGLETMPAEPQVYYKHIYPSPVFNKYSHFAELTLDRFSLMGNKMFLIQRVASPSLPSLFLLFPDNQIQDYTPWRQCISAWVNFCHLKLDLLPFLQLDSFISILQLSSSGPILLLLIFLFLSGHRV